MANFQANKTYEIRFIGDSDLKVPFTVTRRTEKSLWGRVRNGEVKRMKIHSYAGSEYVNPMGNYSMSPSANARHLIG